MKELRCETHVSISASLYHALRFDKGFAHFCASDENATFQQISQADAVDDDGAAMTIAESSISYGKGAVPGFVHRALGAPHDIEVKSDLRYWTALFDDAHPLTFESRPNVLHGKVSTHGSSWLEPLTPTSCVIHNQMAIEIRLFTVGPLLENFAASKVSSALCVPTHRGTLATPKARKD
eukprot:3107726-Prymnesium_polylepis.2